MTGTNGLRYLVADIPLDIVPFGSVESPPGVSVPPRRNAPVNVQGMQQAFDHALELPLPDATVIRIPTPAGFVALKMHAWVDRATDYEDRDAYDLAVAVVGTGRRWRSRTVCTASRWRFWSRSPSTRAVPRFDFWPTTSLTSWAPTSRRR